MMRTREAGMQIAKIHGTGTTAANAGVGAVRVHTRRTRARIAEEGGKANEGRSIGAGEEGGAGERCGGGGRREGGRWGRMGLGGTRAAT